jgi:hypothetical protein
VTGARNEQNQLELGDLFIHLRMLGKTKACYESWFIGLD